MDLNGVIEHLERVRKERGGGLVGGKIKVFVNGEHGEGEPEVASTDVFMVGQASIMLGGFDEDSKGCSPDEIIMQIGGY